MAPQLLTTADVAERVGRHPKTIERAIRNGALRATRLSGSNHGPYGVEEEWVDEWISAGVTRSPQPAVPPMPATPITVKAAGRLTVEPDMGRDRAPQAA